MFYIVHGILLVFFLVKTMLQKNQHQKAKGNFVLLENFTTSMRTHDVFHQEILTDVESNILEKVDFNDPRPFLYIFFMKFV